MLGWHEEKSVVGIGSKTLQRRRVRLALVACWSANSTAAARRCLRRRPRRGGAEASSPLAPPLTRRRGGALQEQAAVAWREGRGSNAPQLSPRTRGSSPSRRTGVHHRERPAARADGTLHHQATCFVSGCCVMYTKGGCEPLSPPPEPSEPRTQIPRAT